MKVIVRRMSLLLTFTLLLAFMSLPILAASNFSYRFDCNPLMTEEAKQVLKEKKFIVSNATEVVVAFGYTYGKLWLQNPSLEEIVEEAQNGYIYVIANKASGLAFYNIEQVKESKYAYDFEKPVSNVGFIAERLFAMKEGYRYNGEVYDVESFYWFDGNAEGHDSYVAIVTEGGTFYETYDCYVKEPDVCVYTKEEFESWYPQYIRDYLENRVPGQLGGGSDFESYVTANGFTPRYGEAQGVARRVLTFGGIGLVGLALVGGTTYAIIRKKRKKKAARLSASVETTP